MKSVNVIVYQIIWLVAVVTHCEPFESAKEKADWEQKIKEEHHFVEIHDLKENQEASLHAHNYVRSLHGVPPLEWDPELAKGAKVWARFLLEQKMLVHDPHSTEFSDNLYIFHGRKKSVAAYFAVHAWYKHIVNYDFQDHNISTVDPTTGVFTSLIWDDIRYLGVGISHHGGAQASVVVARYSPKPNYGDYSEHVKPQLRGKVIDKDLNSNGIYIPSLEDLIPPKFERDKVELRKMVN